MSRTTGRDGGLPAHSRPVYFCSLDTPFSYSLTWKSGVVGVASEEEAAPRLSFAGAMPNPVHGSTTFVFSLPKAASVRLSLFDLSGRLVRQLADGMRDAGRQQIGWDGNGADGSPVGEGIYFARMEALGHALSQRVVMVR